LTRALTTDDQRSQDGRGLVGVVSDAVKGLRLLLDLVVCAEASQTVSYLGQVRRSAAERGGKVDSDFVFHWLSAQRRISLRRAIGSFPRRMTSPDLSWGLMAAAGVRAGRFLDLDFRVWV
jgi:hypothetical protein